MGNNHNTFIYKNYNLFNIYGEVMVAITTTFRQISMAGGNKVYVSKSLGSITCNLIRVVFDSSQEITECAAYGAVPVDMPMGRHPKELRLQVVWAMSVKDMNDYAKSLDRIVPCINNIFMPGMIVYVYGVPSASGVTWCVDTWSIDRTNGRGKRFVGEVTLVECPNPYGD